MKKLEPNGPVLFWNINFPQHTSTPVGVNTNIDGMRSTFVHVGIEYTLRKRGTVQVEAAKRSLTGYLIPNMM